MTRYRISATIVRRDDDGDDRTPHFLERVKLALLALGVVVQRIRVERVDVDDHGP